MEPPRTRPLTRAPSGASRHRILAVYYATGGALLLLVGLAPTWVTVDRSALLILSAVAGVVGAGLLCVRRLAALVEHLLLVLGAVVIALAVQAAGGGVPSAAVAMFTGWVVTYGGLALPRRQAALHGVLACAATALALSRVEAGTSALHITLLVVITGSTGVLVERLMAETRAQAATDALTGLLNEVGLAAVVAKDLASARGSGSGLLLLVDLDRFGDVNQALGRDAGDELLRQVAQAFRRGAERYGCVARLGGDDFAVWLPDVDDGQAGGPGAQAALDAIAAHVARDAAGPFLVGGAAVAVDITVGAALVPAQQCDLTLLLQRADTALHAARREDCVARLWSPELDEVTSEAMELMTELKAAVADGQLRLLYQPLVRAPSQQITGVEALVRWQHPRLGLLGPAQFLPAAERTSVMVALTDWVLEQALTQAGRWLAEGRPLRVSVNLSARLIAHDGLAEQVRARLTASGVPAQLLVLEVTESAVMSQPHRAATALEELRALGVQIALDDFGTGYTSLGMLQDLPLDELKLDRRFVSGALHEPGDLAIARAVVELSHRLGLEVVAEGVEDDATRRLMTELGYDLLQGYHFSRPVPAEQIPLLAVGLVPEPRRELSVGDERARARAADSQARATAPDDPVLAGLVEVAAQVLSAPYALLTLVGEQHMHVLSASGTDLTSAPREHGLCTQAMSSPAMLEVPDLTVDPRFSDNPFVTSAALRFYAGAPFTDGDGQVLGTVCVLDQVPRTLTQGQRAVLETLARTAAAHLRASAGRSPAALPTPA